VKLCKDCKWIRPPTARPMCAHPSSVLRGELSLVTGKITPGQPLNCEEARYDYLFGNYCGSQGKHWEPKQPPEPVGFVGDDPSP
jgi:hypothetical protein